MPRMPGSGREIGQQKVHSGIYELPVDYVTVEREEQTLQFDIEVRDDSTSLVEEALDVSSQEKTKDLHEDSAFTRFLREICSRMKVDAAEPIAAYFSTCVAVTSIHYRKPVRVLHVELTEKQPSGSVSLIWHAIGGQ